MVFLRHQNEGVPRLNVEHGPDFIRYHDLAFYADFDTTEKMFFLMVFKVFLMAHFVTYFNIIALLTRNFGRPISTNPRSRAIPTISSNLFFGGCILNSIIYSLPSGFNIDFISFNVFLLSGTS